VNLYEDNEYKHIESTTHTLKALIDYNLNDNRKSAYEKIVPMFENLEFGDKRGLFESSYNRYLLIYCILLAKNYKQANTILKTIEKSYEAHPVKENLKSENLSWSYINFAENLLYSKLYSEPTPEESEEIKNLFKEVCEKTRKILFEENKHDLLVILSLKETTFHASNVSTKQFGKLDEIRKKLVKKEFDFWASI